MSKLIYLFFLMLTISVQAQSRKGEQVLIKTKQGIIAGKEVKSGVISLKGIPYAKPPVGNLRWKAPQPAEHWAGILKADRFSERPMQKQKHDDMIFRSDSNSEDCLYLNVWIPAKQAEKKFPVLVYFHGGGFSSGDGSEHRYDGESMAGKGVISITVNYRLGVFGFLTHPELSKETTHRGSGNYGLLDQHAALVWIKDNVAALGGDPERITIGGESAGSMSVSAHMASPLSKGLFSAAICQSGSLLGLNATIPLAEAEQNGLKFSSDMGTTSIEELRRLPAEKLLEASQPYWFPCTIDGYFLPRPPLEIFSIGRQMDIPLLGGWTSAEISNNAILKNRPETLEGYRQGVEEIYGDKAAEILKIYAASTNEEVPQISTDLASDRFIAYSTWKLIDIHGKTNGYPVYRYLFSRKRPTFIGKGSNHVNPLGAVHASDIEYALGNLSSNNRYAWTEQDYKTSETMQAYFVNFIKSGNPNGPGLPQWFGLQSSIPKVMNIDSVSVSQPEKHGKRYAQFDYLFNK